MGITQAMTTPLVADSGGGGGTPVSCAYPMGASEAEVMAFGMNGRLALTNSDQTGTYTANGTSRTFGAFPTNPSAPATMDLLTGTKVIEFALTPAQLTGAALARVDLNAYISTTLGATIVGARVRCADDGTFDITIFRGAATVATVNDATPDLDGNIIIGFEMHCDTSVYEAVVQDVYLTLSDNTFTPQEAILVFTTQEVAVSAGDIGKTFSTTARTSAADIANVYAEGATDVCGNALV